MAINNGTDMPFHSRAKLIRLDSPLVIPEVVAVTEASCAFEISPDHRTFVSSKCSRCTICRIDAASPYDRRFQRERQAFVTVGTTLCSEGRH